MLRFFTLSALLTAAMAAQSIDRTKPPATPPIPDFKLPSTQETVLPNGLHIVLLPDSRFPLVTARLVFKAGSKFDPKDMPGLSEMAASLLNAGTKTRTARQIADESASLGGSVSAVSTPDSLTVEGDALAENLRPFLGLVGDISMHANFPAEEISLKKQNRLETLKLERSQPSFLAEEQFAKTVYGDSPYGHIGPTEDSIAKMDAASLSKFRDAYLRPDNATLILVGSIGGLESANSTIRNVFNTWQVSGPLPAPPAIELPPPVRKIILIDRPGSVQADVNVGRTAPARNSPEYFPLLVGNAILGSGANSRMFLDIREKQGFAYDAHSEYNTQRDAAELKAVTQVRNEVVEPALKAVLAELNTIAATQVTSSELSGVKNYLSGVFVLRLISQKGVADQIAHLTGLGLPPSDLGTYVTHVRSTEPDTIQAVAKKYLAPGQDAIVVVGDASKIGDAVRKLGEVTVVPAK